MFLSWAEDLRGLRRQFVLPNRASASESSTRTRLWEVKSGAAAHPDSRIIPKHRVGLLDSTRRARLYCAEKGYFITPSLVFCWRRDSTMLAS